MTFNGVFDGATALVTGHTGFKGSWLSLWLNQLGASVVGVSNGVPSQPCNFAVCELENIIDCIDCDVTNTEAIIDIIGKVKPDFIFHLAAQALVRLSYADPIKTLTTNAIGTANLLEACRANNLATTAIMVTSDKCYDNLEWKWGYRETDPLGGKDPYSGSKGMAELVIKSYFHSYFSKSKSPTKIAVARAGNVIGGGDWASDRIVPDCIRAWAKKNPVNVRSPRSTRPWQHVLEPLSGYLTLAAKLSNGDISSGEAYNFGPDSDQNFSVNDLIKEMSMSWPESNWIGSEMDKSELHEAGLLKLNCDKALFDLEWHATLTFEENVSMTTNWYHSYYNDINTCMLDYTIGQIEEYTRLASERGLLWV